MNIRDIARLAEVSPTTVSQILNHKDENISESTRQRVLAVIKEHGYVPYEKIRSQIISRNRTIGLIIPTLSSAFYAAFVTETQKICCSNGYTLTLGLSSGMFEKEEKLLSSFADNQTSGIILFSGTQNAQALLEDISKTGIAAVAIDHMARSVQIPQIFRDSVRIASICTQVLFDSGFSKIGLALRNDCPDALNKSIISGYSSALEENGEHCEQNFILKNDDDLEYRFRRMLDSGVEAVVCQDADIAGLIYSIATHDSVSIPNDISVISMEDADFSEKMFPPLTAMATDTAVLAATAFESLSAQIGNRTLPFTVSDVKTEIVKRESIRVKGQPRARIVVTGYINMDTILTAPTVPKISETLVSTRIGNFPGGKGGNQAYGITHFGGHACLIGKVGTDISGRSVYDHLSHAGVNMKGVSFDKSGPTGKAYINLLPDGTTSVVIDPGVNTTIDANYIRSNGELFINARYCLCQTDIPQDGIAAVYDLCRKTKTDLMIRYAYSSLDRSLLNGVFLFCIDRSKAIALFPGKSLDEIAADYLQSGVRHVIFTEYISGCIWYSDSGKTEFQGYDYPCVDGTGTSDIFMSCLATLLAEGIDLATSIRVSNWASAYSSSRISVQNSMPSRQLLDEIIRERVDIQFPGHK